MKFYRKAREGRKAEEGLPQRTRLARRKKWRRVLESAFQIVVAAQGPRCEIGKADAPDASAIPWLLVAVASNSGKGALGKATTIHRVNTSGGLPPASCSE